MGEARDVFQLMNKISLEYKMGEKDFLEDVDFISKFSDTCGQYGIRVSGVQNFISTLLNRELNHNELVALDEGYVSGLVNMREFLR